jgi:hypothetical protein
MSRVHPAAARPYSTSLAIWIASSTFLKEMVECTGPKISSRAMRMAGNTPSNTVGSKK